MGKEATVDEIRQLVRAAEARGYEKGHAVAEQAIQTMLTEIQHIERMCGALRVNVRRQMLRKGD